MGIGLRELLAVFDVQVNSEELKRGHKEVEGFKGKLKEAVKYVGEAFAVYEVKEFVQHTVEASARVQDLAETLGLSATQIKAWGFAAMSAGLDLESSAHTLGFLERNLGEATTKGGEAAKAFAHLGISIKGANGETRPLLDVVGDVAEAVKNTKDPSQRAAAAMSLFGREGRALLPVLIKGRDGMRELLQESRELGSGLGDEYYANAKKAREEGEKFGFVVGGIKDRIVSAALPAITSFLLTLKKQAGTVLELTKHTHILTTATTALSFFLGGKLLDTVVHLAREFGLLKGSVLETVKAFVKFGAPAAVILALYLIFDDLFTMLKGGKSVIGDTLNQLTGDADASAKATLYLRAGWEDVTDTFKNAAAIVAGTVIPIFQSLWYVLKGLGQIFGDIVTGDFGAIGDHAKAAGQEISDAVEAAKKTIADAWKKQTEPDAIGKVSAQLAAGIKPSFLAWGKTDPSKYSAHTKELLARLDPKIPKQTDPSKYSASTKHILALLREKAKETHGHAAPPTYAAPRVHGAGGGGSHSVTVNNQNHVQVHTSSSSPKAIGDAVGTGIATATQKDLHNAYTAQNRP
jgi:Phage-related minor tail protein